jgi:hypothetical protein
MVAAICGTLNILTRTIARSSTLSANSFQRFAVLELKKSKLSSNTWRKANQIHKWFVDNIQDGVDECQESFVEVEKLHKLRDLCEQVVNDPDRAAELLPTGGGFFFGSTDYNEWYHRDIKETLDWLNDFLLKDALNAMKGWDFYYRSSW